VSRRPEAATVVFAVLGALLLTYLGLPLIYLFFRVEWSDIISTLGDLRTLRAVQVSLITSVIATSIMVVLGVPLGYLLARVPFPGRRFLIGFVFVPMVLPPLVGGILLLLLYGPYGLIGAPAEGFGVSLVNSLSGIVLAQVFVAAPYVIIASYSAFSAVDARLEQAAATLGDYQWQIFRRVSLPLAWPGIAAGITLAWVRTLGEFGATLIMAYHPNTMPVFLWVQLTGEGLRGALPLALLLLALAGGAIAAIYLVRLLPVGVAAVELTKSSPATHPPDGSAEVG
jgi:molybdate/tungstate transport system permease protein